MLVGYVRPYQEDLDCSVQIAKLKEINCNKIYKEEHNSPKRRTQLETMINNLKKGDTVLVTKLFLLADTTRHLADLLDTFTEKESYLHSLFEGINTNNSSLYHFTDIMQHIVQFQSDIISENTKKGLYEAKQKGIPTGRPRKPDENVKRAIAMYQSKRYTLAEIKDATGISKSTLYRYLES
ncbi:recombinase family protein (plasmid) [Metabacillus halosaccharovorans]|uniref:recombinase family protein n=1 Tax=Bacillaceae TaxID=186817 RepID=UPI000C78077C|nr:MULTISPECIES: recombinase family protein [Bacillaceae]MCM3443546.1 recombinase family protein [Metabacillus halosaccharovorans]PLR68002.1 resolvase [Bacillus sp. UMB0893]PMC35013.1 resolvase [Bacillus sp. UMB0899]